MFTGIVEELGEVVGKEDLTDAARFVIRGPLVTTDAGHGDSLAVNGVGLTVVGTLVTFWPTVLRTRMDDRAERLAYYQSRGFGAAFLSYRGFGGSGGQISEKGLIRDARTAYDWLSAHTAPGRIVSRGTAMWGS